MSICFFFFLGRYLKKVLGCYVFSSINSIRKQFHDFNVYTSTHKGLLLPQKVLFCHWYRYCRIKYVLNFLILKQFGALYSINTFQDEDKVDFKLSQPIFYFWWWWWHKIQRKKLAGDVYMAMYISFVPFWTSVHYK